MPNMPTTGTKSGITFSTRALEVLGMARLVGPPEDYAAKALGILLSPRSTELWGKPEYVGRLRPFYLRTGPTRTELSLPHESGQR